MIHTIIAFANAAGGKVLIGAKDKTKEIFSNLSFEFEASGALRDK